MLYASAAVATFLAVIVLLALAWVSARSAARPTLLAGRRVGEQPKPAVGPCQSRRRWDRTEGGGLVMNPACSLPDDRISTRSASSSSPTRTAFPVSPGPQSPWRRDTAAWSGAPSARTRRCQITFPSPDRRPLRRRSPRAHLPSRGCDDEPASAGGAQPAPREGRTVRTVVPGGAAHRSRPAGLRSPGGGASGALGVIDAKWGQIGPAPVRTSYHGVQATIIRGRHQPAGGSQCPGGDRGGLPLGRAG